MAPGQSTDRLSVALWEADRHVHALEGALVDWRQAGAPRDARLESDASLVRLIDQILYRFAKLQDAVGERLVPATLSMLAEPHELWPMRDKLDRLERLGFLDVQRWLAWRELRNRLSHEYPDQPEQRLATLSAALDAASELAACSKAWRDRVASRSGGAQTV